ncbi:MAG: oligosaccharide flippase family protein [Candidatus Marinimicrobia bacterium]|jgi:O-antigen/teichoic acid export membrane protein|nr:oligosaccharide flippase family protein [Candidatus Neomarinimicrobiota bacterium]MBT7900606.1 oligosaccharide flippase family protein [Candidatus Neomarinimicrobiota bacterium]
MTNKKQQIKNSIIYLIPFVTSSLAPIITIPIFTRIFTPVDFGILALSMIYAIFMCGLSNFGMSLVIDRNYFKYKNDKNKLAQMLYSNILFVIANFTILFLLSFLFKENISRFLTGSPNNDILILTAFAAHFFFGTTINYYFNYLRNTERANVYTKYRVIIIAINFVLSIFLVVYIRVGIVGIVLAQFITGISFFFYFLYLLLQEFDFSFNRNILMESIKISYPLTPRIFIGVINNQFDKYMIGLLATSSGVGIYHIGKRISEQVFILMATLQNVYYPQVYQRLFGQHKEGNKSIGRYLTPFLYISIFVAMSLAMFSEELITILTPASYHGAIPVITILAMYYGFLFFGKINGIQLIYSKKSHITSLLTFFSVILNICLNIPMIIMFGPIGAAGATLVSGLISVGTGILVAHRYCKVYWEWNTICWIMGIFYLSSICIGIMYLVDFSYIISFFIKVVAMLSFIIIGVRYKILTKENYRIIKSIVKI